MKPVSSLMNPVEPSIGSRLRILGIISGCMILVESPNPLITKEAHQYKKADIDPASGVKVTFRYNDEKRNQYLMS